MKDEELYKKEEINSQKINIDILPLLANLYKHKLVVFLVTLIFGIIGIYSAFTSDREYTASEVVVPEQEQDMKSSLMNSLSSFMDLSSAAGSDEGAYNVTIFPEMATSKPFLASLLKVTVAPSEKNNIRIKTHKDKFTLYDYYTDSTRITLSNKMMGGIKKILHLEKKEPKSDINKIDNTHYTKIQEDLIKALEKRVDIVINKKTGITTISFTSDDPAISQQIADTISCRLQKMVINYKTLKAKEKLKYYTKISDEARLRLIKLQKKYAAAADENFFVELQSVKSDIDRIEQDAILAQDAYNTIEKQRISALMEVQDAKPVFVVLEPASYPNKANSSRAMKVILYALIGFILSSIWAIFGQDITNNWTKSWAVIRNKKEEKMKIVKILGGLGNQMFQYALYLALEAYYKEEVIKIDTSCFRGYPLHNGYELKNIYGINALEATFMDKLKIAYPYNHYRIWQIFKRILPKKKSMFLESKNEEFSENVFTQKDNCYYDGYWQNERYFNNIRNIILNTFTPKYINAKNQEFKDELLKYNSVSIHVRRGDYINNPLYGGICDTKYYQNALKYIQANTNADLYCIFSNEIKWCEENLSQLLKDKKVVYIDWNKGKDSYIDMHLMSCCNHNIIANSSFSWWGAWLNKHTEKIVVGPRKWNNIENSKFELPQHWIKI